jgi:hypothetical protein
LRSNDSLEIAGLPGREDIGRGPILVRADLERAVMARRCVDELCVRRFDGRPRVAAAGSPESVVRPQPGTAADALQSTVASEEACRAAFGACGRAAGGRLPWLAIGIGRSLRGRGHRAVSAQDVTAKFAPSATAHLASCPTAVQPPHVGRAFPCRLGRPRPRRDPNAVLEEASTEPAVRLVA